MFAFCGLAVPQIIGTFKIPDLPQDGLMDMLLMCILCLLALLVGFRWTRERPVFPMIQVSTGKLLALSAVLSLVGGIGFFLLMRLPFEELNEGMWSGATVKYNFFSSACTYGFVISLYLYLRFRSIPGLLIAAANFLFMFDRAFVGGRRSAAVNLVLCIILSWWLFRKKTIPRIAVLVIMVLGSIFVNTISDYRQITLKGDAFGSLFTGYSLPTLKNLSNIDVKGGFKRLENESGSEYVGAAYTIASQSKLGGYDFGLIHWNLLVDNYVPAQLFGQEFKDSCKINLRANENDYGYEKAKSTALPGIVDAFCSFWFFGFIKFLVIGAFMGAMMANAKRGNFLVGFIYILLVPHLLVLVSHPTQFFFLQIPYMVIFLLIPIYLLREHGGSTTRAVRRKNRRGASTGNSSPENLGVLDQKEETQTQTT